ncbi:SGNH/GDSL hydrolase family protein [Streptomyces sp. R35]|uniref:SGNH/GDSL hydrolase family protein n=1 Tax=Streptomyces sp. R35 TaxID=3238630 RepID=A0AB39SJJ5_9ACTN
MNRRSSLVSLVVAGILAASAAFTSHSGLTPHAVSAPHAASAPHSAETTDSPRGNAHWVNTWVSMPQLTEPGNMPPAPFTQDKRVLADATVRQTVQVSVGGRHMRLRFSNAFGGAVLPLTAVSVALPVDGRAGVSAIRPGTSRPVTFHGRSSAVVPVGAQLVSDPLDFDLEPGSNLTVTTYLAQGQASNDITSHPGSRTTSYLQAGNHVTDDDLAGATPTNHWYFLSGVETWSRAGTAAAVMLGDSLTDGRGSTTNGNNRWPDQLLRRLQSQADTAGTAILNQAAGGNRVLNDGLGPSALARLDRDVLAQSGVDWLLVFEGVNDIGTAEPTPAAQKQVTDDLIAAYDQIVVRAHAQGIRVYGATLTPFGGNALYDDADGYREASRQAVNQWIRTSGRFDAVVDFDKAARDPLQPARLLATIDDGDHLHLNPAGYQLLADTVPARLFQPWPLPKDFGLDEASPS